MWACLDADWHTLEVLKLQMGQLNKEQTESDNIEEQRRQIVLHLFTKLVIFWTRKGTQPVL
jgi:hypothetical protein